MRIAGRQADALHSFMNGSTIPALTFKSACSGHSNAFSIGRQTRRRCAPSAGMFKRTFQRSSTWPSASANMDRLTSRSSPPPAWTPPTIWPSRRSVLVIDRHVTQGTRSQRGRAFCERMWTVIATGRLVERSILQALSQAVEAWAKNPAAPSLVPAAASCAADRSTYPGYSWTVTGLVS